jgi:signal transduction histidine kinase
MGDGMRKSGVTEVLRTRMADGLRRVSIGLPETAGPPVEIRGFGELLRHELNNPLTGILGNAELLLLELRRDNFEIPLHVAVRLETIASLAVRMRETVRRLSEECDSNSDTASR